jgi:hypothetical protein
MPLLAAPRDDRDGDIASRDDLPMSPRRSVRWHDRHDVGPADR